MALDQFQHPHSSLTGKPLSREWHEYLKGIEKKVCAKQADLAASPTTTEIATAFNALLAAMKAAYLMRES